MGYEYKVETYGINEASEAMTALGKDGWKVISVIPNNELGFKIVVTFEKETFDGELPF